MKRLLLIGWDAADWKIIDPLIARGEMPHLAGLISEGIRGNIATIYPALSPMLWTSIATGKRPHKHGIHGFTEPTEDGLSIRPVSNLGRKTKAFWNILNQNGLRSIVVGWWPSHPAEPIRGAMVSDLFPFQVGQARYTPMRPATVSPASLAADFADLRVHPTDVTGEMLGLFVPEWQKVDQKNDKSLHDLAGLIAETASIHAAATELLEVEEWDVAAIYYVGIDHFSHRFMRFHAGKAAAYAGSDPALFSQVVTNAYRWHDVMLGRLLELAGDCNVMLLSDHGFHSDVLLPDQIPPEAAGPAVEHRHFGIFALRTDGVSRSKELYGATVLDIAPTVLHLCGIPAGADMDGKVLINAFDDKTRLTPIPSWDDVPGDDGRHPSWMQYDSATALDALEQLVNLGYISPLSGDAKEAVAQTVLENRYNLARALLDAGRQFEALDLFEELIAQEPEDARFHRHAFESMFAIRDLDACLRILDRFDQIAEQAAPKAKLELEQRRAEMPEDQIPLDAMGHKLPREVVHRGKLLEKAQAYTTERGIARARLMLAQASSPEDKAAAREFLEHLAEPTEEEDLDLQIFLAVGFATTEDYERALSYTERVLEADPDRYGAMALEARVHQALGDHQKCVERALDSLALVYFQPLLHYHMAISLDKLGEEEKAVATYRVALSQMPGLAEAHLEIARILRKQGDRPGEVGWHQSQAKMLMADAKSRTKRPESATQEAAPEVQGLDRWEGAPPEDRSKVITIVSGLPRSGTSMMMQMLDAAGIAPYTDGAREADDDNPRGYFEHDRARRLHEDASWLPEARGKVVKIVANLLPRLPDTEHYRIVFMHRDLTEVVASQRAMLGRLGRSAHRSDEELARVYAGQLVRIQQWLRRAPAAQSLTISYAEAVADPGSVAERLKLFLGEPFNCISATAAVEPSLQRHHAQRLNSGIDPD